MGLALHIHGFRLVIHEVPRSAAVPHDQPGSRRDVAAPLDGPGGFMDRCCMIAGQAEELAQLEITPARKPAAGPPDLGR
jgi:hypothetical protein